MDRLKNLSRQLNDQDLTFLGSAQYVYHCHHFNLFHDQTIDDALGEAESFRVRERAAYAASLQLLTDVVGAAGASASTERLELAAAVFRWLGHGRLHLQAGATGGPAVGEYLHYSWAWREKYGAKVRRREPADAFAAGFAAAAVELAFDLEPGSLVGHEESCYACMEPSCRFEIAAPPAPLPPAPALERSAVEARLGAPGGGLGESTIREIATGLKDFVLDVGPDDRGLMQGFGVYITRHLSGYYNQSAFETLHLVESRRPSMIEVVEELFGESGHVCVFYTLGNIVLSPEWEALVGTPSGDVMETVLWTVAACRGLGFGHWSVEELVPGERLVLRASSNYEAPFYLERYGRSQKARSYFLASSARAIMRLAHSVDLAERPELTPDLYQSLFKEGVPWRAEITRCLTRGDDDCEVVVSRAA